MKFKVIEYARTVSDGNYGSKKVGVQIELHDKDNEEMAYNTAKDFVEFKLKNYLVKEENEDMNF